MKRLVGIFTLLIPFICFSQEHKNIELVSHVPINEEASDIWGFVASDGTEYAVIGGQSGTHIFSLKDPKNPNKVAFIPGDNALWRDYKAFGNKIYGVADQGDDGVLIIDMLEAPGNIKHEYHNYSVALPGINGTIGTCHNLYIDEDGFMYLAGCNVGNRGILIYDLNSDEPELKGGTNLRYSHDVYSVNDRMYTSDVFSGVLSIYDVTNKSSPAFLTDFESSNRFTHNAWVSTDGNTVYTTDEVAGGDVEAYDISDLSNINFLDNIESNRANSPNVIVHNVHVMNDYLITSHYTEGVTISDASDPSNIVEVGFYDTFQDEENLNGAWFDGCWGAFPYFPSGLLIISDISKGLFVLKPTYERANKIKGIVIDAKSKQGVNGAYVYAKPRLDLAESTDLEGKYSMGFSGEDKVTVVVDHPLYDNAEFEINIPDDISLNLTTELIPNEIAFFIQDELSNQLGNTQIKILEKATDRALVKKTDGNGFLSTSLAKSKRYDVVIAKWGYKEFRIVDLDPNEEDKIRITLKSGYEDSFIIDNLWTTSSLASAGDWALGTPKRKTFRGMVVQPSFDSPNDIGNTCYFTDLSGGGAGSGDVDGGTVFLKSPSIKVSDAAEAVISFDFWFANESGSILPNDEMTVYFESFNGDTIHLATINESVSAWREKKITISVDRFTSRDGYRLIVTASDDLSFGHVVEAGFDNFKLDFIFTTSEKDIFSSVVQVYPSPAADIVFMKNIPDEIETIQLISLQGDLLISKIKSNIEEELDISSLPSGIYFIWFLGKKGYGIKKIIKQ